jgi:hypothetical protein
MQPSYERWVCAANKAIAFYVNGNSPITEDCKIYIYDAFKTCQGTNFDSTALATTHTYFKDLYISEVKKQFLTWHTNSLIEHHFKELNGYLELLERKLTVQAPSAFSIYCQHPFNPKQEIQAQTYCFETTVLKTFMDLNHINEFRTCVKQKIQNLLNSHFNQEN